MPHRGGVQAVVSSRQGLSPSFLAAALTLLLHAGAWQWLAVPFSQLVPSVSPVVTLRRTAVDPARLPPAWRLAETSPAGNREAPPSAPFLAARNQTAAQPHPIPGAQSNLPHSAGESNDSLRLAQATPAPPSDPLSSVPVRPAEAGTPRISGAVARPNPLLAPSRPTGTSGLILRNPSDTGRAGSLALDARFSAYGDYAQRLLEAVQSSWWLLIERRQAPDLVAGTVIVRFRLLPDGSVPEAEIVFSSVGTVAALACKDAVTLPAPYDAWRPEMAALLGDDEWVTITFHYR